jgi:hypothetical protein
VTNLPPQNGQGIRGRGAFSWDPTWEDEEEAIAADGGWAVELMTAMADGIFDCMPALTVAACSGVRPNILYIINYLFFHACNH